VNFSYPARPAVKALDNLSLTLKAGKFTALVGTSGGGKSTMVSLLLGTYDYEGSIMIGDDELRTIDGLHRRSQFAVLEQDCILFSGTVFDNICYGLIGQDLSEEEKRTRCDEAIKDAAVDFLDLLPDGLNTHLSNEVQLSGGQRQRICLARALIKKPALLILDEPTSALDARSEVLVMDSVKKATAAGTTVIMVAHRLSTTLDADHIIVMGEGHVLEEGTPEELSESPSIFSKLLKTQNTNYMSRSNSMESTETLFNKSDDDLAKDADEKLKKVASHPNDIEKQEEEVIKPMGLWTVTKRIGGMIKPQSWIVFIGICGSIAAGGILLGESVIFGSLVQLLNESSSAVDRSRTDFYCLIFFILGCIAFVAYISSGSAFGVTSTKLTSAIRVQTLHRLLHLDIAWFSQQNHSLHDLMAAFTKDPGDLSCLSGIALGTIFTVITSVFGGIILAHVVAWKIAIVLLAAVPIMIIAGFLRLRTLTLSEIRHREAYKGANTLAAEACRSRKTVAALGMEERLLQDYRGALNKPLKEIRRFTIVSSFLLAFCLAISYFVYALAYWWGSKQVRDGNYSTRDFFTVLPALLFSAQAAGQLFSLSPEIARAKTAARSIFSLLEAKSTILSMEPPSSSEKSPVTSSASSTLHDTIIPSGEKSTKPPPKLLFDAVSLSYPGNASKRALSSISLSIPPGSSIAFVGPSGGGKSSTIALIERFFDPSSGSILLDGIDIRSIDVRTLRRTMALVAQDPDLFPGSIAYNVSLGAAPGSPPITQEQIESACRKCGLHDFIVSLPEGYSTPCGSGSTSKLSGGQKQRLSIARALIRDPEILLLDEPTSALDAHSEAHVQAALTEAARGRTTIVVAHRLSSVVRCDRIYVFDQGRIVAGGSHAQLIAKCGLYAGMCKAQALA
jgi:ABC-type multidrug transport system fused ATPase/permease subunit